MTGATPIKPSRLWATALYEIGQGAVGSLIAGGLSAVLIVSIYPYRRASDSLEAVMFAFLGGAAAIAIALVPAIILGGTNALVLRRLYSRTEPKASVSILVGLVWGVLPFVVLAWLADGSPFSWLAEPSSEHLPLLAMGAIGGSVGSWHGWRMFRYLRTPEPAKNVVFTRKRPRPFVFIGLAVLTLMLTWAAAMTWAGVKHDQSRAIAKDASNSLQIGMTRFEVERQLEGRWQKRYRCYGRDAYLFGSSDPNLAGMLNLHYRQANGVEVLENIWGIDISMFPQFESCPSTER